MPNDLILSILMLLGTALVAGFGSWLVLLVCERLINKRISKGRVRWNSLNRPVIMTSCVLAVYFVAPAAEGNLGEITVQILSHAMSILAIIGIGWMVLMLTDVVGEVVSKEWDIEKKDNRKERSMLTKFRVMRRVWIALVSICTVGAVLMTFPSIRSLGAGMLASAGVAGIVLGIALRPTLETMLASVQLALTEPINIDDVVIVENEWGRIEEINPTYVVVRIWDDRRLIVPLTYFISKPFQNWTRNRAEITGAVALKLDFKTPVGEVRKQVGKLVEQHEDYDGRFWNVQITDADDRGMTLRVLCTAADASKAWNLRCAVREQLIDWLQKSYPDSLPRLRAEVDEEGKAAVL